jgi:hypothetical protein
MFDEEKVLQRIQNLTPEEWTHIMKKALDEAHIPYTEVEDGNGEIIFDGLPQSFFDGLS